MDTDALRWFQQVADGVTVTEVSELEGVSQPGVSRALARLEVELGTPLLRRSGRTLRVTHAGSAFKRHVDAMLHQLDDGLAAVEQIIDPESGTVALAYQASLGSWLVPSLVSGFRADHPGVNFTLAQVRDDRVESVLGKGRADLVLSTWRSTHESVRRERLMEEPLALAVPADHALAGGSDCRLADAADEDFLTLTSRWQLRQLTFELCASVGFQPSVSFEGEDLQTIRGFVAAGLGVAIVPVSGWTATAPAPGPVRLLHLSDVPATREIGLSWATERRLLPAAEQFREYVLEDARSRR